MSSADRSRVHVDAELPGAQAWALRHDVGLTWLPDALTLRTALVQPGSGQSFYLRGIFTEYRELPPLWTFCDEKWETAEAQRWFPNPPGGQSQFGASVLIQHGTKGVICAHFNRLAYADAGIAGPHGDWGGPAQWLSVRSGQTVATTLGEMLAVIYRDFQLTNGRMANG